MSIFHFLLASILLSHSQYMHDALYIHFGKLISRKLAKIVTFFALIVLLSPPTFAGETLSISEPSTASPFVKSDALLDPENRISEEFIIPEKLIQRTAFWFDIYTKYGSFEHLAHHTLYPWIVYKVISTESILTANGNRWTKYHRSERYVKNETRLIRQALKNLSRRKNYKNLSPSEKEIFSLLKDVKGSRRKVFKEAYVNFRVQLGQKDFFTSGLFYSKKYLPTIEKSFRESGLPTELARLPFVESSFNVEAESKVGASGIWQIMPTTGKSLLIINSNIDERNSPIKASYAAIEIFKKNYRSLKQWPLAVTAYNHGAAGVHRALKASHTSNLSDLVEKYHRGSFKFASANFYTCFLAALYAEKYNNEIFADAPVLAPKAYNHKIVKMSQPTSVRKLLRQTGLTHSELLKHNLDLKRDVTPSTSLPRGYRVILPVKTSS